MFMFRNQSNLENKFGYPFHAVFGPSGKTKPLKNSDEHFEWLKKNEESVKVWRECGDLKAISNKYTIDIVVMIVDKKGKLQLPLNTYEPDEEYKWKDDQETPKIKRPTMVVVNKSDHYSLVVKTRPMSESNEKNAKRNKDPSTEDNANIEVNNLKHNLDNNNAIEELKREVEALKEFAKKCICNDKKVKDNLGSQPLFSEPKTSKGINMPVEKEKKTNHKLAENWRCEICNNNFTTKPLLMAHKKNKHEQPKTYFQFSKVYLCDNCGAVYKTPNELKEHKKNTHEDDVEMIDICDDEVEMEIVEGDDKKGKFKCNICNLIKDTKNKLITHMKNHDEDADWVCDGGSETEEDCSFQSNGKPLLISHVNETGHKSRMLEIVDVRQEHIQNTQEKGEMRKKQCPFCNETFTSQNQVTRHRKDIHPTFKPCRNIDKCKFQSECFFSHELIPEGKFRCFQCGDDFNTRHDMMIHRKSEHIEDIKTCKEFVLNQCDKETKCWWKHETQLPGFWQAPENLAPPVSIWNLQRTQQETKQNPQNQPNQRIMIMLTQLEEQLALIKQMIFP